MRSMEPAFDGLDPRYPDADELASQTVRRQRIAAFLADSARYLGLAPAAEGGGRYRVQPPELSRLSAGVAGC